LSYTSEHGAFPLYGRIASASEPNGAKWYDDIMPQLPQGWHNGVYRCPTYRDYWVGGLELSTLDQRPDGRNVYISNGSYAYNCGSRDSTYQSLYGLAGNSLRWMSPITIEPAAVRESEVQSPSDMIAVGDSLSRSYHAGMDFLSRNLYMNSIRVDDLIEASQRHRGRLHTMFADGHVEANTLKKLFFDTDDASLRRWHIDNEPHAELFKKN